MVKPPRLIRFLVARIVPGDLRQDFLADLDELFQRRVAESGATRARFWYARQVGNALPHLINIRRGRSADRSPRQEPRMGMIDKVVQDVRSAVRVMRRFPASTLAAVTTLAVCIGEHGDLQPRAGHTADTAAVPGSGQAGRDLEGR